MGPVVEKILLWVVTQILTPDVIKGSEKELVSFLHLMADKSSEPVLLNGLVDVLAVALGV